MPINWWHLECLGHGIKMGIFFCCCLTGPYNIKSIFPTFLANYLKKYTRYLTLMLINLWSLKILN